MQKCVGGCVCIGVHTDNDTYLYIFLLVPSKFFPLNAPAPGRRPANMPRPLTRATARFAGRRGICAGSTAPITAKTLRSERKKRDTAVTLFSFFAINIRPI